VTAPVFLVDPERLRSGERILLDGAEGRHAATVRRITNGERVDLTDGAGMLASCVVVEARRDALVLDVTRRRDDPAPASRLVVVQALAKGDWGELAVQTLTEVGVDVVVPWAAARSVARWRGERGRKALDRWRTTAREAAKQARRSRFPDVVELASTAQVVARLRAAALGVVLHEEAREPLVHLELPSRGDIVMVVGPEGGITTPELTGFLAAGGRACRLGPSVLRTSTAGVAGAAVLLARAGRWD
jgi:16S rRNA (uracil1498-N3)-methyltransferase